MKNKLFILLCLLLFTANGEANQLFKGSPFSSVFASDKNELGVAPPTRNMVSLVDNGNDALLLRVHLIRHASKSIKIQTFIWRNDECGRLIMYELIEAAKRGVKVRILADHIASEKDPNISAFLATAHKNIEIKHYRPVADRIKPSPFQVLMKAVFRFKRLNQRMHNKIMIFDDSITLTGGRNIENTYYNHSTKTNFKDLDVLAVGPVVSDVCDSFSAFWNYRHSVRCSDLIDVAKAVSDGSYPKPKNREDFTLNGFFISVDKEADATEIVQNKFIAKLIAVDDIRFISDAPGKNKSFWLGGQGETTRQIQAILKTARRNIIIQSPYLVLSRTAQRFFKKLRKTAPDLNVIISTNSFGSTDNIVAYSANYRQRSLYIEQLKFNVYEYKPIPADLLSVFPTYRQFAALAEKKKEEPPFLCIHSKALVIDDRTVFIGSYNMDPRSENLNTEAGLIIKNEQVAALLKEKILNDCSPGNSWVIAKKKLPLQLDKLNAITEGISGLSPIDVWPLHNTSSFELIPGKTPLPPDDPGFYSHYEDTGSFPDMEDDSHLKEVATRIYKAVGGLATPLF